MHTALAEVLAENKGGPLSPLLANILLDDLDKELERRGHHFVRYADDFIIMVKSLSAGNRVMASIRVILGCYFYMGSDQTSSYSCSRVKDEGVTAVSFPCLFYVLLLRHHSFTFGII
jgi:hypothetical protein